MYNDVSYNNASYNGLDPNNNRMLQNELSTIVLQLRDIMERNYFGKILDLIESERKSVQQNPPREMQLLENLKPFFTRQTQEIIEKALEIMTAIYAIKQLQEQIPTQNPTPAPTPTPYDNRNIYQRQCQQCLCCNSQTGQNDRNNQYNQHNEYQPSNSVHQDGIYEYDHACLVEKQNKEQKKVRLLTDLFYDVINRDYVKNTL